MYIDYVRVDDDIANDLFGTGSQHNVYMNWLNWEASQIANHSAAYRFYIELFEYNNFPCMEYVNRKMDSIVYANSGNTKHFTLLCIPIPTFYTYHVPWADRVSVYSKAHFKKFYLDKMGAADFMVASYPFNSSYLTPEVYTTSYTWTRIPSTLPNTTGDGVLAPAVSPAAYDTWLQEYFDESPYMFEPGHSGEGFTGENEPGHFRYTMQRADSLSKTTGKNFIFNAQAHIWKLKNYGPIPLYDSPDPSLKRYAGEVQREPTNEELDLTTNIPVTYGARGIMFFEYTTTANNAYGSLFYDRGIVEYASPSGAGNPRYYNIYGQEKWEHIKKITARMKKWGPYLMSFDNEHRKSCIYRLGSERPAFLSDTYFADIVSYKTGTGSPSCTIPSPNDNPDITPGLIHECNDDRYLQAAVFKNPNEQYSNYFMIVNRRCSPYVDASSEDNRGGRRYMSIRFDANRSEFDGFNNWSIIDVEADTTVASFDKRVSSFLNLEWFNPGQGKLYRVIPTMYRGGTFAGDENIGDITIDIDTTINANGKNLTLGAGVTLNFKNNASIKMNGGNFICGTVSEAYNAPKSVHLNSQSGMKWGGICLNNMDTVHIQNTEVKDVDADSSNHGYGISLINAKVINIDNCNLFNTSSTAAGIQVNYVTNLYMSPDINITGNTIKISTDTCDGIYIHPYSWLTLTPYIYKNKIINTSSGGGEFGIFGFDLEGTAVKNNYIENFQNGILTWYSSLDLFENTIDTKDISNGWDLYGIVSEYNLSNAYESRLGGSNILTTKDGRNICLDALDINLTDGNNIFNVNDSSYGYHMAGYYPTSKLDKQNANNNCFKILGFPVGDEYEIRKNVTESDGLTQVTFDFGTFGCPSSPNYCDFYIGGTPTDTVWIECGGGMGGGHKDNYVPLKTGEQLQITNYELSSPQENIYKQIYDSLSINMRKKQYELAAEKCITLLDNYPDSAKVINCVDKLYRTAIVRNKVSELKSYYESFIQNHPNNTQIISRMFYYIQKAKAELGQYQSALQGFQTIINQFPASYEGLAARWDYMATQLLDTSSGSGGGEQLAIGNEQLTAEQEHEKLVILVEDPVDKYDKKKFSKEDRKVIVTNIVSAFETQKTKETKKLKELEVKIIKNEASENEKKEYKTKSKLKEVVRPQKVRNISEQISIVQSDIKKVFPLSERKGNIESKISVIPLEYKLSQNYPNPFNPTTKINYEIKKAGFVSLKIYDLLGREIAELVNENKDAGKYTIDFNASKYLLASGIYFYRIKAGEFIDAKRMVLIK